MWALLRASLAAAAKDSRVIMVAPRPVAPATPASAAAPMKRRRLRPPSGTSGVSLLSSSLFFIASNSVIGYGGLASHSVRSVLVAPILFSAPERPESLPDARVRYDHGAYHGVSQSVAGTCDHRNRSSGNPGSNGIPYS